MERVVKLRDKSFRKMISAEQIESAVSRVAEQLNRDYADCQTMPIVVGVLNGSFIFMSDLVRKFEFGCELSFVKISSYDGMNTSGKVKELIGLSGSIEGRDVIVVEDIVDTGVSITYTLRALRQLGAKSVKVCTLFFKPEAYRGTDVIDYAAMEIGNEFIVGYGLDYDQMGRELGDIYVFDGEASDE